MDKTIESKLFAEFQSGAAAMCLEYIKEVIANDGENLDERGKEYYSAFPAEVVKRTEAFDDIAWPVNVTGQCRIAQEISDNLDNCANDGMIERYIISILEVFEGWANIFTPVAKLRMLDNVLRNAQEDKEIYTPDEIQQEIERVSNMHDDYLDIMRGAEKGTMEYYLNHWHRAYSRFAKMLAAICAEHRINLLEIQKKRGIWIIEKLDVLTIQSYFGYSGDFTYANNLLKSLPRTAATENLILYNDDKANEVAQTEAFNLPSELATAEAMKYFPRAVDCGYMELTAAGYKWLSKQVRLGYFCLKIYPQPRPITALEKYFGVTKLSASISQADLKPSRADVKQWRVEMDNKIFFD